MNIFAIRATDPRDMKAADDPEGPNNEAELASAAHWANMVIAAWGVHGAHRDQGPKVANTLRKKGHVLYNLGLTKDGHPRHPLYLPYSAQPIVWT